MKRIVARLAAMAPSLRAAAVGNAPDAMLAIGAGLIGYGAWLVYPTAGYITGGVLLLVGGVIASRGAD